MTLLVAARDEDGQSMSDEEIRDELITLLRGRAMRLTATSCERGRFIAFCRTLRCWLLPAAEVGSGDFGGSDRNRPVRRQSRSPRLNIWTPSLKEDGALLNPVVQPSSSASLKRIRASVNYEIPAGNVRGARCIYLTHRRPDLWHRSPRYSIA